MTKPMTLSEQDFLARFQSRSDNRFSTEGLMELYCHLNPTSGIDISHIKQDWDEVSDAALLESYGDTNSADFESDEAHIQHTVQSLQNEHCTILPFARKINGTITRHWLISQWA